MAHWPPRKTQQQIVDEYDNYIERETAKIAEARQQQPVVMVDTPFGPKRKLDISDGKTDASVVNRRYEWVGWEDPEEQYEGDPLREGLMLMHEVKKTSLPPREGKTRGWHKVKQAKRRKA